MNTFFVILILAIFIIDAYSFKGFRFFIENWSGHARIIFTIVFWSITLTIVALLLVLRNTFDGERDPAKFVTLYYFGGIILLIYLPKINFMIFHLMEDIIFAGSFLIKKLALVIAGLDIKTIRLAFLSKTGLILALVNFLLILYGMAWGRFDYRVREIELPFSSLPVEFDGLTIVQISDIHVGSFHGYKKQVERGVKIANEHNADITVFTGDLVNNFAEELDEFIDILKKIDGSWAKYSIMGNHDYGDYWEWKSEEEKKDNLKRIHGAHKQMGFDLLLNENRILKRGDATLAIIGVENWGLPPFKQYGDLAKAMVGTDTTDFKILLSHDPTHWKAEILPGSDIDLTLSGHTHGMQFGIITKMFRWSPVGLRYDNWGGLYEENGRYLYVNLGFGYIGFPGRVGIPPEITVIKLKSSPKD